MPSAEITAYKPIYQTETKLKMVAISLPLVIPGIAFRSWFTRLYDMLNRFGNGLELESLAFLEVRFDVFLLSPYRVQRLLHHQRQLILEVR
jgi:hypothetical protein